jgi:hypothetical protein
MLVKEPLDFAKEFIKSVNQCIEKEKPGRGMSRHQQWWLAFCITCVVLTNSMCWAQFERISLGRLTLRSISWMFRRSKILWEQLLVYSVRVVLKTYDITEGVLVLDDSDRTRSKNTKDLHKVYKLKDKKTNGYVMGQNLVFLVLVTPKVTIPVGFAFYEPDPAKKAWRLEDNRLKKQGIAKKHRPAEPDRNPQYPTKQALALRLLRDFATLFPEIHVACILADALYSDKDFMHCAAVIFGKDTQVISQLRSNQIIRDKGHEKSVKTYFTSYPGVRKTISIRGGEEQAVMLGGARLWVKSHQKKRFVIALRYEGEQEDRYIVATDTTWRMTDIAQAYTIRWLVEVFFSDWKQYEGWCLLAKQPGAEGSSRGVILSLLTDHALLLHPEQKALLKHKLPACTVGSLREQIRFDAIMSFIAQIIDSPDPGAALTESVEQVKKVIALAPSKKHLNHRTLGRLEPTASLKYKAAA